MSIVSAFSVIQDDLVQAHEASDFFLWGGRGGVVYENNNYAFPLSSLSAIFIILVSIMHFNNGFSFDEAFYSVIFWM